MTVCSSVRKIPSPPYLEDIKLPYFVHVIITPYHQDIERHVPDKRAVLKAVKTMAQHDPRASVIVGHLEKEDRITIRKDYKLR